MANGYGKQRLIRVGDMRIDPTFQRPLNQRRSEKIAETFDPELFGEIILSLRENGEYVILDGQHRQAALLVMGWEDQRVPSIVHEGLTRQQEARIFRLYNLLRVRPSPIDLFHSAVAEGNEAAIEIKRAIKAIGMDVATGQASVTVTGQPGKYVNCIGKVQEVHHAVGIETLKTILDVCIQAWGPEHTSFLSMVVDGLGRFYSHHNGAVNTPHLVKVLSRFAPYDLLAQARGFRAVGGDRVGVAVAMVIEARYNAHAGQYKVPDTGATGFVRAFQTAANRRRADESRAQVAERPREKGRFTKKVAAA